MYHTAHGREVQIRAKQEGLLTLPGRGPTDRLAPERGDWIKEVPREARSAVNRLVPEGGDWKKKKYHVKHAQRSSPVAVDRARALTAELSQQSTLLSLFSCRTRVRKFKSEGCA